MSDLTADRLAIREIVENWVIYRDAGDWERFVDVWHSDGWMTATWFQGPATDFIEVSRVLFDQGGNILHTLGGWTRDILGDRAIPQRFFAWTRTCSLDSRKDTGIWLICSLKTDSAPRVICRVCAARRKCCLYENLFPRFNEM